MSDPFLWIKWVHILSATLLFGTGIGTAFHMFVTYLRGDVHAVAVMTRNTVLADWLFIATSGVVQPASGFLMIYLVGYDPFESWLVLTYLLYMVAGACWLKVVQIQYRLRSLAVASVESDTPLPESFHQAMRLWFILGCPAFLSLVLVFALMVMKPTFW